MTRQLDIYFDVSTFSSRTPMIASSTHCVIFGEPTQSFMPQIPTDPS
jgi:hypothetical protein